MRAQPDFQQARPLIQRRVAFAKAGAVRPVSEHMHFRRHAIPDQRVKEVQRLLNGHGLVCVGVVHEGRRRVFGDVQRWRIRGLELFALIHQVEDLAVAQVLSVAGDGPEPRIAEHHVVRPA